MKPEAQRIKIAEACGWTKRRVNYGPRTESLWISPEGLTNGSSETAFWLPDYLSDLNACHAAISTLLSDGSWRRYRTELERVCNTLGQPSNTAWFLEHNATAPQRCEAFLRCIGAWVE